MRSLKWLVAGIFLWTGIATAQPTDPSIPHPADQNSPVVSMDTPTNTPPTGTTVIAPQNPADTHPLSEPTASALPDWVFPDGATVTGDPVTWDGTTLTIPAGTTVNVTGRFMLPEYAADIKKLQIFGDLTVKELSLDPSTAVSCDGTVTVTDGGTVSIPGHAINNGTLTISDPTTIGGTVTLTGANAGSFDFTYGTLNTDSFSFGTIGNFNSGDLNTITLNGGTGITGGTITVTGGSSILTGDPVFTTGTLTIPAGSTITITGGGSVLTGGTTTTGGIINITSGGSTINGTFTDMGTFVLPFTRDLPAGTSWERQTISDSLKGMITNILNGSKATQKRMSAEAQKMVDFLQQSMTSLGLLNTSKVEVVVDKKPGGLQTDIIKVTNRNGTFAELRLEYGPTGIAPTNVKFSSGSILRNNGNVTATDVKKYLDLYVNSSDMSAAKDALAKLSKGGSITGSFYFWSPVPAASYMDFTSSIKQGKTTIQKTLRVWGDGHVSYTETTMTTTTGTIKPPKH